MRKATLLGLILLVFFAFTPVSAAEEYLFVADSTAKVVHQFRLDGSYVAAIGSGILQMPRGVFIDSRGNLVVGDGLDFKVFRNGQYLSSFGSAYHSASSPAIFGAVDASGNIYTSTYGGGKIEVYDRDYNHVNTFSYQSYLGISSDGAYEGPIGIAYDPLSGNLLFTTVSASTGTDRKQIEVSKTTGAMILDFGLSGNSMYDCLVDASGNVLVKDMTGSFKGIRIYNTSRAETQQWLAGKVQAPYGIARDSGNHTYVSTSATAVSVYSGYASETPVRVIANAALKSAEGLAVGTSIVSCDFNSDGKADLVWHNRSTGQLAVWLMNGTSFGSAVGLTTVADTNWRVVAVGDLDGDGKNDLVWRNRSTGDLAAWIMNGTTFGSAVGLTRVSDSNWQLAGLADFNGDGKNDLLWQNRATGDVAVWIMNGTAFNSSVGLGTVPDTNWKIVGVGDFNGDGKPDILWRNQTGGQLAAWLMNGTTYSSSAGLPAVPDLNWKVAQLSDVNGDGKVDIVWHNATTGELTAWLMNGTSLTSTAAMTTVADTNWKVAVGLEYTESASGPGGLKLLWHNQSTGEIAAWNLEETTLKGTTSIATVADLNWRPVGLGDFNGDGQNDILWHNRSTGQVAVWAMNGNTLLTSQSVGVVPDPNWRVTGVGDLNSDGKPDILWRNISTGQLAVWLMNGTSFSSAVSLSTVADLNWRVAGAGDFNGDGKADLLWHNASTGQMALWIMNGTNLVSTQGMGAAAAGWQIAGVQELNGDGKPDILWHNPSTGSVAAWLMNGTSLLSSASIGTMNGATWQIAGPRNDLSDYAMADFAGTWRFITIWSKDGLNTWGHSRCSVDASGNLAYLTTMTYPDRTQDMSAYPAKLAMDGSGIVQVVQGGPTSFRGKMTRDKGMIVGVDTDNWTQGSVYQLVIMIRENPSVTYSASDLAGIWYVDEITAGDAPNWTGWSRFTCNIDAAGNGSMTQFLNSSGYTGTSPFKLSIGASGVVTMDGESSSTWFGFMSPDKKSMATLQVDVGNFRLSYASKMDGATVYSLSDLNGAWYGYKFDTGDKIPSSLWDPNGWDYNEISISNGTMTVTNPDSSRGPRAGSETWTGSIASNGKAGIAGMPSFEFFLLPNKNLAVGTMTNDAGSAGKGYSIIFMVK